MTRAAGLCRLLGLLVLLALPVGVTGCAGDAGLLASDGLREPPRVDTPRLARLRDAAGIAPCPAMPGARPAASAQAPPDLHLDCLGGGAGLDLADVRGPVVLNGFASWCEPCREEMPIYARFAHRYGDRVPVLGVNTQETSPQAALELARDTGVTYPLLADRESSLNSDLRRMGLPLLVMIDAQGRLVYAQGIVISSLGELRDLVREHLGVRL